MHFENMLKIFRQIDAAHLNIVFQEALQVPEGQSFTEEYLPETYYCKNPP